MIFPTKRQIKLAVNDTVWDPLNEVIYRCCRKYPSHRTKQEILTKTMLIGRVYSVELERRKNATIHDNEDFFRSQVYRTFKNLKIDTEIPRLRNLGSLSEQNIWDVLSLHFRLVDGLYGLTAQSNRSFASKYLHFHLPKQFPIYDSRAAKKIGAFRISIDRGWRMQLAKSGFDKIYGEFAYRVLALQRRVNNEYGKRLTLRQLDKILLYTK